MKVKIVNYSKKQIVMFLPMLAFDWEYKILSVGWLLWEIRFSKN